MLLDDLETVQRIDRGEMLGKLKDFPAQCLSGWRLGLSWRVPEGLKKSDRFLVLGMGGSAIGADLLEGVATGELSRPVQVNRHYRLPAGVGRSTLVLCSSYSGNTEETLSAAGCALKRGARLVAVTSGGKLRRLARRRGFPLLLIPPGLPPRAAVGFLSFAPLGLLSRLGWAPARLRSSVPAACEEAGRFIQRSLAPEVKTADNPAKEIARSLEGRLPILYGSSGGWEGVTFRWRTQLEENAKTLAFHHLFPEATHNEISGWVQPRALVKKMTVLFLLDPAVHPRVRRRMEFTRRIIEAEGAKTLFIELKGSSRVSRLLKLIALGDFVSAYLGLLYRTDPTPVVRVEALKKYMR
ncbi:MAG: bifunctional phosphoglucose/phosphomannose isomerase [Candidatus Omnitrophica bacterium]|nr:bifunctional phosphoglucose/phosphomannose isomerase [Candidatus Omnitrophota bacterium]